MFYDHYRIHEAPLVLRQKLFSDSAGGALIGGAIASLAAKALPGPLGSALEFRFGRIISLNELCDKGEGSMNLGASSLSIQAWLFDDELDSLNVHDAQTIGDKITAFPGVVGGGPGGFGRALGDSRGAGADDFGAPADRPSL